MSSKKPPKQKKKKVHSRLEGKMIVMGPGVGSLLLHGHCGGERASTRELLSCQTPRQAWCACAMVVDSSVILYEQNRVQK